MLGFASDPSKAASNKLKHGVSFAEAATAFEDPLASSFFDETHSDQEERFILIGFSRRRRLLFVVYTEATADPGLGSLIRLIGARVATILERHNYEQQR